MKKGVWIVIIVVIILVLLFLFFVPYSFTCRGGFSSTYYSPMRNVPITITEDLKLKNDLTNDTLSISNCGFFYQMTNEKANICSLGPGAYIVNIEGPMYLSTMAIAKHEKFTCGKPILSSERQQYFIIENSKETKVSSKDFNEYVSNYNKTCNNCLVTIKIYAA